MPTDNWTRIQESNKGKINSMPLNSSLTASITPPWFDLFSDLRSLRYMLYSGKNNCASVMSDVRNDSVIAMTWRFVLIAAFENNVLLSKGSKLLAFIKVHDMADCQLVFSINATRSSPMNNWKFFIFNFWRETPWAISSRRFFKQAFSFAISSRVKPFLI